MQNGIAVDYNSLSINDSLITISPENAQVEFNDCYFENIINFDENSIQEYNCISINSIYNESLSDIKTNTLNMNNCIIKGFSNGIKGAANYYITLEKLHIEKCKNNGISLKYPLFLNISKSTIEKNHCRGILIQLMDEEIKLSSNSIHDSEDENMLSI